MRIFSEEEYFEILLERAAAIYAAVYRERDRCAKICETRAGPNGLSVLEKPRDALLNVAAAIRGDGV